MEDTECTNKADKLQSTAPALKRLMSGQNEYDDEDEQDDIDEAVLIE